MIQKRQKSSKDLKVASKVDQDVDPFAKVCNNLLNNFVSNSQLCCGRRRQAIWEFMENPKSSSSAQAVSIISMCFILMSVGGKNKFDIYKMKLVQLVSITYVGLILSSMKSFQKPALSNNIDSTNNTEDLITKVSFEILSVVTPSGSGTI